MDKKENINNEEVKPKMKMEKKSNKGLIITLICIVTIVILISCTGYFLFRMNSINIYQKAVNIAVDNAFKTVNPSSKLNEVPVISTNIDIDCNVDLIDKEDNPLIKLLKEMAVSLNIQLDKNANKSVIHLKTKYDNNKTFDASMFMNLETYKAYIYAKDISDEYLELDMDKNEEKDENKNKIKTASMLKAEKILKQELAKIITEDMCSKKDGLFVLRTTTTKLIERITFVIDGLANNEEFLNCYENPKEIKENLENINLVLDKSIIDEYEIEMALDLGIFFNLKTIALKIWDDTIETKLFVSETLITIDSKQDNKDVLNAKIEMINIDKDNTKLTAMVSSAETGKLDVIANITRSKIDEVDKMDLNKVKKLNELTIFETMELSDKFNKTELGIRLEDIYEYQNKEIIDKAQQAIAMTNVANINNELTLAYIDLKLAYPTSKSLKDLENIVVNGKKYKDIESYYKAIVPQIDENSDEYEIVEGYEVVFSEGGTALVMKVEK